MVVVYHIKPTAVAVQNFFNFKNYKNMRVHLHSRRGMYTVDSYDSEYINLSTRRYKLQVPVTDFKAFAGGIENYGVTAEEKDKFISVVQPERYQKIIETEEKLLAIINQLQAEEKEKEDDDVYDYYDCDYAYEDEIDYSDYEYPDYEELYYENRDELYKLNSKMRNIAYKVYSQKLDFSKYQNNVGVKFIIQRIRS